MTIESLLKLHDDTCIDARKIMQSKNHDYTSGSADPFANFRAAQMLGVHPVIGICMRLTDKLQRIRSFCEQGRLQVANESVDDAIVDIVNYAILARGMVQEARDAAIVASA